VCESKFDRIFGNKNLASKTSKIILKPKSRPVNTENARITRYRSSDESGSSPDCKQPKTSRIPTVDIEQKPIEHQDQIKLFDDNEELPPLISAKKKRKTIAASNRTTKKKMAEVTIQIDRPEVTTFSTPAKPIRTTSINTHQYSTPCHDHHFKNKQFSILLSPILLERNLKPLDDAESASKRHDTLLVVPNVLSPLPERKVLCESPIINLSAPNLHSDPPQSAATAHSMNESNKSVTSSRLSMNNSLQLLAQQFLQKNTALCAKISNPLVSSRAKLLLMCEPPQALRFSSALSKTMLDSCRKIAEGSYGEIYRAAEGSVIKVVSVQNQQFEKLLPEVLVSMAFNQLQERCGNFIRTTRCMCVTGPYPKSLENEWRRYDAEHKSQNEFPSGRQHLLFTLDDGGDCLEQFTFESMNQAVSVFEQVLCSLAMAERAISFEHRDLHWGNVLIAPESQSDFVYRLADRQFHVTTHGVHCRLIDFSLSRASIGQTVFHSDLSAEASLFDGKGDRQFDIYRQMRDICKDEWQRFCPRTNVLWLHYLLDKLLLKTRSVRRRGAPEAGRRLRLYSTAILKYESAEKAMIALLS
jgi:hypothetical protein